MAHWHSVCAKKFEKLNNFIGSEATGGNGRTSNDTIKCGILLKLEEG
jgi:hypothetical protein